LKLAVGFGLITGIVVNLWRYLSYINEDIREAFGGVGGAVPFILLFVGIAVGIYFQRRSEHFGVGLLSFKEGAKTGVLISVIAGLCSAAFLMFLYTVINPDYMQEAAQGIRDVMGAQNKSPQEIEQAIQDMKNSGKLGNFMFAIFSITLVIGMVGSFLIAALLKKEYVRPSA